MNLCACPSVPHTIWLSCIVTLMSVQELAFDQSYSFFFFFSLAGRGLMPKFTQEANARAAAFLLGLTLALGQLNLASCILSSSRAQGHIHLAKGWGNPSIPSLFCFYFWEASCSFYVGQGYLNLIIGIPMLVFLKEYRELIPHRAQNPYKHIKKQSQ